MKTNQIGIILLAAGESARLGEPKQLLRWRGETLLRRSVKTALVVSDKIVVTLGARIESLRREIADLPIQIVENKNWKNGMSGSLRIGLEKLSETNENLRGALVMVCDQPLVDEKLLTEMIEKFLVGDVLIVACEYAGTLGVPALFSEEFFSEMLALDAPTGAKKLISKYAARTTIIAFPGGALDVDTPADYENLIKNFK